MSIFEFISTWAFGYCTHMLTNDQAAVVQCRQLMLDLKRKFEDLQITLKNTSRSGVPEFVILKEIKQMLENLGVASAGLIASYKDLPHMVEKSLNYIRLCNISSGEAVDKPYSVAVDVLGLWGMHPEDYFQKSVVCKASRFFNKSVLCRLLQALCNKISCN